MRKHSSNSLFIVKLIQFNSVKEQYMFKLHYLEEDSNDYRDEYLVVDLSNTDQEKYFHKKLLLDYLTHLSDNNTENTWREVDMNIGRIMSSRIIVL